MPTNEQQTNIPKRKKKFFTLLTFVLLVCIIELVVSTINNTNKSIHFSSKIKGLEEKRNEELVKNKQLKSELENFNSEVNLESIAICFLDALGLFSITSKTLCSTLDNPS